MSLTKVAVIVGLILSVPILFMIQFGSNQLEKNAESLGELQKSLADLDGTREKMNQAIDELEYSEREVEIEDEALSYPIKRRITNLSGSTISVTITGRSRTELKFYSANSFYYSYPIKKLSPKDQEYARKLPVVSR